MFYSKFAVPESVQAIRIFEQAQIVTLAIPYALTFFEILETIYKIIIVPEDEGIIDYLFGLIAGFFATAGFLIESIIFWTYFTFSLATITLYDRMILQLQAGGDKSIVSTFEDRYFWAILLRFVITALLAYPIKKVGPLNPPVLTAIFVIERVAELVMYHDLNEWYGTLKMW